MSLIGYERFSKANTCLLAVWSGDILNADRLKKSLKSLIVKTEVCRTKQYQANFKNFADWKLNSNLFVISIILLFYINMCSGPSFSKLTMSLVNDSKINIE